MPDYMPLVGGERLTTEPVVASETPATAARDAVSESDAPRHSRLLAAVPALDDVAAEAGEDEATDQWLAAARSVSSEIDGNAAVFVAAHGGAGVTTWSRILGGVDAGQHVPLDDTAQLILVTRASAAGIEAAKTFLAHYSSAVTYILVIPAAPGKTPKVIANELRVLAGAAPLALAPWVPALITKRPRTVEPTDVPIKDMARLRAAFPTTQGELS